MLTKDSGFVIIPAFNEGAVIQSTVEPLLAEGYRIIVVDDCSRDNTWEIVSGLPVVALRHRVNLGQGGAIETGMEYARRHDTEFVVHFDADGQHDPHEITGMLQMLADDKADIVFGSRFLNRADVAAIPLFKRLVLRGGIWVSGFTSGVWLTDTHNGFRALSRKALHALRITENGYAHATDVMVKVHRAGLRYAEYPTHVRYTDYSRMKGQSSWNAINILLDVTVKRIFSR